jgi:hypothetical protein
MLSKALSASARTSSRVSVWMGCGTHHRLVVQRAQRGSLRPRRPLELRRDDGGGGYPVILEENAVVHTARCAGPSVGEALDEHLRVLEDLLAEILRRGAREVGFLRR